MGEPQAATIALHVAYVANLVGINHVGITLDYDPNVYDLSDPDLLSDDNPDYWPPVAGYDQPIQSLSVTKLPEVCEELVKLGCTQAELAAIMGGNFRRIATLVWK